MTRCEEFACERLEICPGDIEQRIEDGEDGLGSALSVLGGPCSAFDFEQLLETSEPTSHLPVLFSSRQFTSPALVNTTFPLLPAPLVADEYWYGKNAFKDEDTLWAKVGSGSYYFNRYFNDWSGCSDEPSCASTVRSVPGVSFEIVKYPTSTVFYIKKKNGGDSNGVGPGAATACQLSGNGQVFFMRGANGWMRHRYTTKDEWDPIGKTGAGSAALELHTSFDGNTFVQSNPASAEYYYKIGSAELKTNRLAADESKDHVVRSAVSGNTIFIARGRKVYSVGSLDLERVVFELTGDAAGDVITGLWADAAACALRSRA